MIDEDIKFGLDLEYEHYELLKNKFDKSLEKNTYKYALFDYIGDKCFIELKSRRNASTKYKDTMIGCNKLLLARNCAKEVYFVFAFTDGLFYYHPAIYSIYQNSNMLHLFRGLSLKS